MDENNLINLNFLNNIILDERKLVTYISISKEMSIHVNRAKILLQECVNEIKKNMPQVNLTVSYLISGISENNKILTSIMLEEEMKSVKDKLKTVFFEHIYSVCFGRAEIDKAAFVAVNSFEDYLICNGTIKSDICVKRSFEEIGSLKIKCQSVSEKISKNSTKTEPKHSREVNHKVKSEEQHENINDQEIKSKHDVKCEIPSPKRNNFVTNGNNKTVGKNNGKPGKSIMGFFSKSSNTTNKSDKLKIKEEAIKKENEQNHSSIKIDNSDSEETNKTKKSSKVKVDQQPESKRSQDIKFQNELTENKAIKTETTPKEFNLIKSKPETTKPVTSSKRINNGTKKDKKRKRVMQVSDSESDNEKNDPFSDEMHVEHESEDEIPPTPSTNIVKITSGLVNPKKRRRIVDKTYTDEEGFILTKKEEIYESCSDEEVNTKENVDSKKEKKIETTTSKDVKIKNVKKKTSPPQKGKQPTMMSFFKKVPN